MRRGLLWLLFAALTSAPAAANYYQFTGTISIVESSKRFFPRDVSVSGAGVGFSSRLPANEIRSFRAVSGFTGTVSTVFGSTGGFQQKAIITRVGDAAFSKPSAPAGLKGRMAVGGVLRLVANGTYAAFPLTSNGTIGLGLGGTVPANLHVPGFSSSLRFGTWTTGTVLETGVVGTSHPVMGSFTTRTISAMGYDARTPSGMGTVQLVTPIRVLSGYPTDRAAIAALTLHFAPEPGRGALLLGGGVALALVGRLRRRPPRPSLEVSS